MVELPNGFETISSGINLRPDRGGVHRSGVQIRRGAGRRIYPDVLPVNNSRRRHPLELRRRNATPLRLGRETALVALQPLTNQKRAKIQPGGSFFMALDGCSQERLEHFFLQTPD
jgi:hypothetical protein